MDVVISVTHTVGEEDIILVVGAEEDIRGGTEMLALALLSIHVHPC